MMLRGCLSTLQLCGLPPYFLRITLYETIMKFDTTLLAPDMQTMAHFAQAAEEMGFDRLWVAETNSDPFLGLTLAAEHSQRMSLGTGIAVAFPRSPAVLAMMAWDLARFSQGRFILGLGTQVRAHNERRLGVKWEKPVRKLRETIEAIHALWDCWQHGTPLKYKGEFFRLNLMTPFFTPEPLPPGVDRPPIYIAAVNELMLQLVGKRCDGVFLHPFHTQTYIQAFARPQIQIGLAKSGRDWADVSVTTGVFVVPTDDEETASHFEQYAKQQVAFYMSTPAYRVMNEIHGWEETAAKLGKMARRGDWAEMPALITDEMLDAVALSGTWAELPSKVKARYGGLLDRVSYYYPFVPGERDEAWRATIAGFLKES